MYTQFMRYILVCMLIMLSGCKAWFMGGGRDLVTIDLPFSPGYDALCTQGAFGEYSHDAASTRYDIDFDTPNSSDEYVYAPVSGQVYVHDSGDAGFGVHANIDLHDGTYIVLGHLKEVFVDSGSEVALGQLLGFEGSTGHSSGDHVHIGRHRGEAAEPATYGQSIDGLAFRHRHGGGVKETQAIDMICSLMGGYYYESDLALVRGHPSGTLLKSPRENTVYLVEDGDLRPFVNEAAFFDRGYSFRELALASEEELECYDPGEAITEGGRVYAARNDQGVWLVVNEVGAADDAAYLVNGDGWAMVLASYGIHAASVDDVPYVAIIPAPYVGTATFRDGTLVSGVSESDVYVAQNGVGLPIESWDTLLALGFEDRMVFELSEEEMRSGVIDYGSCATGSYCLRRDDLRECYDLPQWQESSPVDTEEETMLCGRAELTFRSPWGVVDELVLSGDHRLFGQSTRWVDVLDYEINDDTLEYEFDACYGDAFHFSVAFIDGASESWSCHAPFPPGILQGEARVTFQGAGYTPIAWDAPYSDGCDLYVRLD